MNIVNDLSNIVTDKKRIVFVSGNFNIMHPGHLRLLKFAKESGDFLVVGVNKNDIKTNLLDSKIRLESVNHSMYVDYAFVLDKNVVDFIKELKPSVVVKGSEHEFELNDELKAVETYGGKLIFSSGDIQFSSLALLKDEFKRLETSTIEKPISYLNRHNIDTDKLLNILNKFDKLDVLVIGDTIVDEYKTCEPLGMSQEDPTIVVSPISSDMFLGGAAIVAAHAAGLGANVDYFTILGDDEYSTFVSEKLSEYNVNGHLYTDASRPTTLKQRFRANRKTLLRVNHLKQHHINVEIQNKIICDIESLIKGKDLIVFSDFSYGCLPQNLIEKVTELGIVNNIMMVADSQSSSQTGDISKFNNMTLSAPTEREARLSVNDFESGFIVLAEKLMKKSNIRNLCITLGSEGVLIQSAKEDGSWLTDQIPALNVAPQDVSGAGDSFLIASSIAIVAGCSVIEGAYIGSLAAALQVGRVGNVPLVRKEILNELTSQ